MRLHLVLIVLAFAAARARAEPDAAAVTTEGGKRYIASGLESLTFAHGQTGTGAAAVDIGHQLGHAPVYARLAAAASGSGYVDAHGGVELRAGSVVKGIVGVDTGYQHDPREVDRMFSVEGPYIAPRLGLEIGTSALWLRGSIDWRYTLAQGAGRASAFGLVVGHDF